MVRERKPAPRSSPLPWAKKSRAIRLEKFAPVMGGIDPGSLTCSCCLKSKDVFNFLRKRRYAVEGTVNPLDFGLNKTCNKCSGERVVGEKW